MSRLLSGILDNDSAFGQLMTRIGILIGANLMFLLFCIPVVTIGPALAGLYTVMLRTLRSDGVINPFREFWKGFRTNFKQGIAYWLILIVLALLGYVDIRFCASVGGIFAWFQVAIYVLAIAALILTLYFYPTLAAFDDTLPHLLRNSLFFAAKNPIRLLLTVFIAVFPMVVTALDVRMQPLYVFLWATCGFSAVAMFQASLLKKDFAEYLPPVEDLDSPSEDTESATGDEKKAARTLREMKKMGM